jgi:hypothetical protein
LPIARIDFTAEDSGNEIGARGKAKVECAHPDAGLDSDIPDRNARALGREHLLRRIEHGIFVAKSIRPDASLWLRSRAIQVVRRLGPTRFSVLRQNGP